MFHDQRDRTADVTAFHASVPADAAIFNFDQNLGSGFDAVNVGRLVIVSANHHSKAVLPHHGWHRDRITQSLWFSRGNWLNLRSRSS